MEYPCIRMMQSGVKIRQSEPMMKKKQGNPEKPKTARASVSFPLELHDTLEKIAEEKKVSLAWVVRDAAERYVAEQWPLLEKNK